MQTSESRGISAASPVPVDQKGGRGESAEGETGAANQREAARLGRDASEGQRASAGVEEGEENEAPDEEQVEAAPPASKVEPGKDHRVDSEDGGEEQLLQRETSRGGSPQERTRRLFTVQPARFRVASSAEMAQAGSEPERREVGRRDAGN